MPTQPTSPPSLEFSALGFYAQSMLLVFLVVGIVFFYLSFTLRFGRSRWPLHALLSTGILCVACGLVFTALGIQAGAMAVFAKAPAAADADTLMKTISVSPFWFGLTTGFLGLMAMIRTLYGMIREPGPRF